MPDEVATFPMQTSSRDMSGGRVPVVVAMRAYEVYSHVYGPQQAMIEGSCRGGFSEGELIAFLYAFGFPKPEWSKRVDEALTGLKFR